MPRRSWCGVPEEELIPLAAAAERSGQAPDVLRRWCATGKLRCARSGDGWLIPLSEFPAIAEAARDHETAVEELRVTGLAVPTPAVPPNLADEVASRLGLQAGNVSLTPLAIDGLQYVVAVWRGAVSGTGGLPALKALAEELDAVLLDGEVRVEREGPVDISLHPSQALSMSRASSDMSSNA